MGLWILVKTFSKPAFIKQQDKLISLYLRDGSYCTEKHLNRKRVFIPMDPQVYPADVLKVQRNYNQLKCSTDESTFRRRLTQFSNIPEEFQFIDGNFAVVKYVDKPKHTLKEKLCNGTAKHVEKEMNKTTDNDFDKQRDEKQLRNFKYNLNQNKVRKPNENAADQELDMTRGHEFVQSAIFERSKERCSHTVRLT